jgi:hypothetical protein
MPPNPKAAVAVAKIELEQTSVSHVHAVQTAPRDSCADAQP